MFNEYLHEGYYPFFTGNREDYYINIEEQKSGIQPYAGYRFSFIFIDQEISNEA